MANLVLRMDPNIFVPFLELSNCSPNLDPWTLQLLQNYFTKSWKSPTHFFENIILIYLNILEIYSFEFLGPNTKHNKVLCYSFIWWIPKYSISIVLNKDRKYDVGILVFFEIPKSLKPKQIQIPNIFLKNIG